MVDTYRLAMHLSPQEKAIVARVLVPDSKLGTLASTTFFIWIAVTLWFSCYLGSGFFLLVYLYGLSPVLDENLTFTATPKNGPWTVSNGDVIQPINRFAQIPISLCTWGLLILFGYLILKMLSNWRKQTAYRKLLGDEQ